jgi:hypothetical protein
VPATGWLGFVKDTDPLAGSGTAAPGSSCRVADALVARTGLG